MTGLQTTFLYSIRIQNSQLFQEKKIKMDRLVCFEISINMVSKNESHRIKMRTVTFHVPDDFVVPDLLHGMKEDEIANILTIAAHLPSLCKDCIKTDSVERIVERITNGGGIQEKFQSLSLENCRLQNELNVSRELSETRIRSLVSEATHAVRSSMIEEHENARKRDSEKIEDLELKLRESLLTQCEMRGSEGKREREMSATIMELRARVHDLERPTSVGRVAELDVAGIFKACGFHVQDTSMGEKKEAGYLDLLIEPEEVDTRDGSNMRIAVEVKNVKTVQRKDLDDFDEKVKRGILDGKFDAALFLSLRSHTKKTGSVCLEIVPDASGKPSAPIVWLGTERGKNVQPITQEVVESMACMITSLLSKCHEMRRDVSTAKDTDTSRVQELVGYLSENFTGLFMDLTKQCRTLDELRTQLTQTRARCISMFHCLWTTNRDVAWLSRDVNAPWMDAFLLADSQPQ